MAEPLEKRFLYSPGETANTVKHTTEGSGILVSHRPGDLVHRTTGEFQQFPRLADTKMLDIFDRLHTGGGLEAAQEGSLLKPGMCGHIGDTGRPPGARLQPVLHLQDRLVAMRQPRRKTAVMSLLPTGGVDQQEFTGLDHHRRPKQPVNNAQTKIGPCHQPTRRDDIAVFDDDLVYLQADIGKALAKPFRKQPVGRGGAAGQKTCRSDDEGTAATGGQRRALRMPVQQPAGIGRSLIDFGWPGQPAGYDEDIGMPRPARLGVMTTGKLTALTHAPVADAQFRPTTIL